MSVQFFQLGPDDVALMNELLDMFGDAFDDPLSYAAKRPG